MTLLWVTRFLNKNISGWSPGTIFLKAPQVENSNTQFRLRIIGLRELEKFWNNIYGVWTEYLTMVIKIYIFKTLKLYIKICIFSID